MIIKEQLKRGNYLQSDTGSIAYVDKICPNKIRVWINNQKDYILDEQLQHWSYGNPIINGRIVNSITFAVRFKQFLDWIPKGWTMSQPHYKEEFEYMRLVVNQLLNYQIQTATDERELDYLRTLKLL